MSEISGDLSQVLQREGDWGRAYDGLCPESKTSRLRDWVYEFLFSVFNADPAYALRRMEQKAETEEERARKREKRARERAEKVRLTPLLRAILEDIEDYLPEVAR